MSTPTRGKPPRKQARRGPRPMTLTAQAEMSTSGTVNKQPPQTRVPKPLPTPPTPSRPTSPSSSIRFADIQGLNPLLLKAIPYEHCSEVQAATLPTILSGKDVLAQAKTGTGKTLGFLVPSIQRILEKKPPHMKISTFILSPTRELAFQIAEEAQKIGLGLGQGKIAIKTIVGGTNPNSDIKALNEQRVDILVATPGRAKDMLERSQLRERLSNLSTLVLDEADRLLDQGFKADIERIIKVLPGSDRRQALLFSATVPNSVHAVANIALKKGHEFISTISEDDVNTHDHVRQEIIMAEQTESLAATYLAINREQQENPDAKIIVFLPTARATGLFHGVFANLKAFPVWQLHSRLSQSVRTKTTEAFRVAKRGVLFSSDVSARGIDIKDITAVIQVGAPSDGEQYVHRLGRTARAGAEGHGVLIISEFEKYFLKDKTIKTLTLHPAPIGSPEEIKAIEPRLTKAMDGVETKLKEQVYAAWLGYYKTSLSKIGWKPQDLVDSANRYAREVLRYGPTPPPLMQKTVGMMGLKGVPGLNIVKNLPR